MIALIVDDEPTVRNYVRSILQREGFVTLEAEGGRSALEIVNMLGGRIDLIVTDIQMPEGDGLSLAHAVSARFPALPIIVASGHLGPDAPFEFLEKPFSRSTMQQAIRRLVSPNAKTA
jgi:DNA-binding NtrC family response regulator